MPSRELGEIFEGYFVDTCTENFPIVFIGERETPSSVRRLNCWDSIGTHTQQVCLGGWMTHW